MGSVRRRPLRRRISLVLALAAATAAGATAAIASDGDAPGAPRPHHTARSIPRNAVRIDIGANPVSRPIPPGFIGLSIEYPSAPSFFGDPADPDRVFAQLVRNLTPGQSPVLRFGGDTTDWTWWPTPGVARPPGIRYELGPGWIQATRAMAEALHARLLLGINLEADSAAIAHTESTELLNGIGRRYIAGFELGNEPEVYGTLGWYFKPNGAGVPGRRRSYGFRAYLRDYARIAAALPRAVPLAGPASGAPRWLTGLKRYLHANPRVGLVTFHRYPLHRCFNPRSSPTYPTIRNLLNPAASIGLAESLAAAVHVAHAAHLPFRSDELNSVSCGGARRVSDTFASALWTLNTLFAMAQVGIDGVNIHTFRRAIYQPFALHDTDGAWSAGVKPMYYGLLLFARAAPPGSRLLAGPPRTARPLSVWATRAGNGTVRVVAINESSRQAVVTAVRAPSARTTATAQMLRAPRIGARSGVTLGGQTFGTTTTTGTLTGTVHDEPITAVDHRFLLRLPPASATLLTIGGRS